MKKKTFSLIVMVSMFLLVIGSIFCFAAEVSYEKQEAMADEALKHLGEHYLKNTSGGMGCTTPKVWNGVECTTWKEYHKKEQISCIDVRHFDCSGFISFCAKAVGFDLGHLSPQYLYDKGPIVHVPLSKIRKGTLVFKEYANHDVSHVGIYIGNGKIVECGGGQARVHITPWDAWLDGARKKYYHLLAGNLLYIKTEEKKQECTDPPAEVSYEKQKAMADEALKHLGEHYLKNNCGEISQTTPKICSGELCNTWKEYHKKEQISYIGVRHFCCSGFIYFCANQVGYNFPWLPGYPSPQYWYDNYVTPIPLNEVRKGTLVFKGYGEHDKIEMAHVGIYLGDGRVIECGGARARVCITSWDAWLDGARKRYYCLLAGNLLYMRNEEKK